MKCYRVGLEVWDEKEGELDKLMEAIRKFQCVRSVLEFSYLGEGDGAIITKPYDKPAIPRSPPIRSE